MGKWLKPHECPECHKKHSDNQKMCDVCHARTQRQKDPKFQLRKARIEAGLYPKCGHPRTSVNSCPMCAKEEFGFRVTTRAQQMNRRAKEKGVLGRVSSAEVRKIAETTTNCSYCGLELCGNGEFDHKTPYTKGGDHTVDNLQLICRQCNQAKGELTDTELRQWIDRLVSKWS